MDKRKQYFLIYLYSKYLKRKMERERIDTQALETTFQDIKKITGISNIKHIVEKVINKDKEYNLAVSKVSERETKMSVIKDKIKKLDQEFIILKNNASFDVNEINNTLINYHNDKGAEELFIQENKLKEELEEMKEKNENVELIYEKVIENMNALIKDKHQEEYSVDGSINSHRHMFEDDLIFQYENFLTKMNDVAYSTYSNVKFT